MTDPADLVRDACDLLAGYLPVLERLLAEPSSPDGGVAGMILPAVDAPEPWNAPAARALMDSLEGIRRLKALLLYETVGHPGPRHGMSDGNTRTVLQAIPKLAAGLNQDGEAAVARILERWVNEARCIPAIDEAPRWRPLPGRPCPYCDYWALKANMDNRPILVTCWYKYCPGDSNGLRPVAAMGTDDRARPGLIWADGRFETAPDLDG